MLKSYIIIVLTMFSLQVHAVDCNELVVPVRMTFEDIKRLVTPALQEHYKTTLRVTQPVKFFGFAIWQVTQSPAGTSLVIDVGTDFKRMPLDPNDEPRNDQCFVTLTPGSQPYTWAVSFIDCFQI